MRPRIKYHYDLLLVYLMIFLFIASVVLETSAWASRPEGTINSVSLALKAMRYFAYGIALLIFLNGRVYPKRILTIMILVILITALSMLASTTKTMFLYTFLFLAVFHMESEKLIKCTFFTQVFLLLIIVGCSLLGIIPDYVWIEHGNRVRHFLGFGWTTTGPVLYFFILLQYIFLKKGKINIYEYVILMLIDVFFYKRTNTRTCFYISVLFLTFFLTYSLWF